MEVDNHLFVEEHGLLSSQQQTTSKRSQHVSGPETFHILEIP